MSPLDTRPWRQYLCRACGLIYDEAQGDPDSGLAPGTRFEDIPDDWVCPLCGVVKADFEPYEATCAAPARPGDGDTPSAQPAARDGVVIVGAGIAGWSVAEAVRAVDADIAITVVTACRGDRYHKPEISVALGRRVTPEKMIRETATQAARRLRVRLLAETHVVGLSPGLRQLRTTRGTLRYTRLVLAHGSRPALPATLPARLCWRVNDLAGWSGLHARLDTHLQRVAIVGAGMVGVELAEDFAAAGHAVTLIDVNEYPLSGLVPVPIAQQLCGALETLGVRFLGGTRVTAVDGTVDGVKRLTFNAGASLEVDEVVAATGLATESRLAMRAGLAFDNGVAVDPKTLQTSDDAIYAVGDCVSIEGRPCRFIEPIARQAHVLAHHMLGRACAEYEHGTPVIRLKGKAFPIVVHGVPRQGGVWETQHQGGGVYVARQWLDGQVVARLEARRTTLRYVA